MRLLRLLALCLGVFLSAADANGPRGCVITEMNNDTVELKSETRKPFYLWPGSSLSSLSFALLLNAIGGEEVVETINLRNETRLPPEEWNKIEFSTTKTNDRSFPSVSIPAINVTRILRNCSNCSLKELQIKVEGRAMLALNCSNNTKPTSFYADHRKDAVCAENTLKSDDPVARPDLWNVMSLLLLVTCVLLGLGNLWGLAELRSRRPATSERQGARSQEADQPGEEVMRAPHSQEPEPVYEELDDTRASPVSQERANSIYEDFAQGRVRHKALGRHFRAQERIPLAL